MPTLALDDATLHYQDLGAGRPVIALHGFSETSDYWRLGGFADLVTPHLRLIALDLRGHGRTRADPARPGYVAERMAADIEAVADALELPSYDILAHATGSVVALRHAMTRPARLRRLAVTSAASATAMVEASFFQGLAAFYARHDWPAILPRLRAPPAPFLNGLDASPDRERLWLAIETIFAANRPPELSAFVSSFYTDPNPRLIDLARITAPTLVVTAEHDNLMEAPSRLLLQQIPDAREVRLAGVGHMTALECPGALAEAVLGHLAFSPLTAPPASATASPATPGRGGCGGGRGGGGWGRWRA